MNSFVKGMGGFNLFPLLKPGKTEFEMALDNVLTAFTETGTSIQNTVKTEIQKQPIQKENLTSYNESKRSSFFLVSALNSLFIKKMQEMQKEILEMQERLERRKSLFNKLIFSVESTAKIIMLLNSKLIESLEQVKYEQHSGKIKELNFTGDKLYHEQE